jgi:hypothetical protein
MPKKRDRSLIVHIPADVEQLVQEQLQRDHQIYSTASRDAIISKAIRNFYGSNPKSNLASRGLFATPMGKRR